MRLPTRRRRLRTVQWMISKTERISECVMRSDDLALTIHEVHRGEFGFRYTPTNDFSIINMEE
jgi:hypothetical protein